MAPLTVNVSFTYQARMPPVDSFHGFAVTVTPAFTVTFVYCGKTSICARSAPDDAYVWASAALVMMFPNAYDWTVCSSHIPAPLPRVW